MNKLYLLLIIFFFFGTKANSIEKNVFIKKIVNNYIITNIDIENEVNLLNAKLLFTNKLFKTYNLNNNQKYLNLILFGSIPLLLFGYILHTSELIYLLRHIEIIAFTSLFFGIILFFSDQAKTEKNISTNCYI